MAFPRIFLAALLGGTLLWSGCRSGGRASRESSSADVPGQGGETLSLYEQRLVKLVEDMQEFEAMAAAAPEDDYPEVERHFHNLVNRFKSVIADNPKEIEARLIYAKLLDRFGDREGALEQCAEVLQVDPSVAVAHQMAGTYFAEEGDYAKALAYYLNALEQAPNEAVYHFGLGDLLYTFRPGFIEDGVFDAATLDEKMVAAFRRAAELAPNELSYQFRYGECFYDLPNPTWSLVYDHWASLSERTDLTPLQHDAIRLHMARCLGEMKRYAEARQLAQEVASDGLMASRKALLDAIDEAEARPGS